MQVRFFYIKNIIGIVYINIAAFQLLQQFYDTCHTTHTALTCSVRSALGMM